MQLHHPASLHVLKWSLCFKAETHEMGRRTRVEEEPVGTCTVWPRRLVLPGGASRWAGCRERRPGGASACCSVFVPFLLMHFISPHSWVSPQIAAHVTSNGKQQDVVQMDATLPMYRQPVGVGGDMSVGEAQRSHPRLRGVWKKWAHCCHLPQQVIRAWEGPLYPGSFRGPISPQPFTHSVPGTGDRPVKQHGAWRE